MRPLTLQLLITKVFICNSAQVPNATDGLELKRHLLIKIEIHWAVTVKHGTTGLLKIQRLGVASL